MADVSFTPEQTEKLLVYAAGRLGIPPEQLREAFRQKGVAGLTATLHPEEAQQAAAVLQDREKVAALLQDPTVRRLLAQWLGQG